MQPLRLRVSAARLALLFAVSCLPFAGSAVAEITWRPRISSPRTAVPPVIDGKLEDTCWQNAATASHFLILNSHRLAQRQTSVLLTWDPENLYVAFVCDEPRPEKVIHKAIGRDDPELWRDDCVEIFLASDSEAKKIYHILVNAAGTICDESIECNPASWNARIQASAVTTSTGWNVEISVPLRDLHLKISEGSVCRINFSRRVAATHEVSSWSPCDETLFRLDQLGSVRLIAHAPGISLMTLGDALGDLGKAGAMAKLKVANPSRSPVTLTVSAITCNVSPDGCIVAPRTHKPQSVTVPPNGQIVVSIPYQVSSPKGNRLHLGVRQGDLILFDTGILPLKDRFLRSRIDYAKRQCTQQLTFLGSLNTTLPEVPALRARISSAIERANSLAQSVGHPAPETVERWIETDRKLRAVEKVVHDADVTTCILMGYTPEELLGTRMLRQYVLFTRCPFDLATADARPKASEIRRPVTLYATPGEIEPATLLVCSNAALENVTVKATDLIGTGKSMSARNIDIRVLKQWWQAGTTPGKGPQLVMVPELLLKDDRVLLKGPEPDVPPREDPVTDIPAGTTKQFWLTVSVPNDAVPGFYQSTLTFIAPGQPVARASLHVRVLPFTLPEPPYLLLVEYRNRLAANRGLHSVSQERYQREIANIREHGFRSVTIFDESPHRDRALAMIQKAGLTGPIAIADSLIGSSDIRQILQQQRRWKYPPLMFYLGSPAKTPTQVERALHWSQTVRSAGGTTLATITPAAASDLRDVLDIPFYSISDACFVNIVRERLASPDSRPWNRECYTWEAMQENPSINRLLCGFYLWKTGVHGAMLATYQEVISGEDPFNDSAGVSLRQRMITYPSRQGPIDTIQWEAAREGVDDLRYITLVQQVITGVQHLRKPGLPSAIAYARQTLDRVRNTIQTDYRLTLRTLKPRDYQLLRAELATAILKVMDALGKNGTVPGATRVPATASRTSTPSVASRQQSAVQPVDLSRRSTH